MTTINVDGLDINTKYIPKEYFNLESEIKNLKSELSNLEIRETALLNSPEVDTKELNTVRQKIQNKQYALNNAENGFRKIREKTKNTELERLAKTEKLHKNLSNSRKKLTNQVTGTAKGIIKSSVATVDPFAKSINKNDVGDTGAESIRLVRQGVNKTITGVKTVKRSAKTVKNTGKTTVKGTRIVLKNFVRTVRIAGKTVYYTGKIAVTTATHAVALAMNPVVWIIALIIIIILSFGILLATLFGGNDSNVKSATGAVGLATETQTVADVYNLGIGYFNTGIQNLQNGFNTLVDSKTYTEDDKKNSNLISLRRTKNDGTVVNYVSDFATTARKDQLKAEWQPNAELLTANEVIAIAYVKLEKAANVTNQTIGSIYTVNLTQADIDQVLSEYIKYPETSAANQYCPAQDCTEIKTTHTEANPDYVEISGRISALEDRIAHFTVNSAADGAILQGLRGDLSALESERNGMVPSFEITDSISYTCNGTHTSYNIELEFNSMDEVMTALGFTDSEKQWVELTVIGFESNPDITVTTATQ
jgi:hypothetical protein